MKVFNTVSKGSGIKIIWWEYYELTYVSGVSWPIAIGMPTLIPGLDPVGHLLEQGSALLDNCGKRLSAI